MVKRIKTVTETINKPVEPLIQALFSYFNGPVNYTLAGYVSKTLISFFGKKPLPVMTYILKPE